MLIPEIILYNSIKAFLSLLQTDYNAASDKTQTILNDLFAVDNNGTILQLENLNYLEQAVALFARTTQNPRMCAAYVGYNQQRAFLPAVHILMPQEVPGRYGSLGLSAGEVAPIYNPGGTPPYEIVTLTVTYRATFDLLCTSDNTTDVLLIYYMLKSLFPYLSDTFEILGLHNFKTTGMDVQLDPAYAPPNIFHRTMRVEFDYQSQTQIRNAKNFANSLQFLVCSKIGDENTPPPNTPNVILSNNFAINITKTNQSGMVGNVIFTNKSTKTQIAVIPISLTGQGDDFEISGDLVPASYIVEISLQNFSNTVTGVISDGVNFIQEFNTNGQGGAFNFDESFDMSNPRSVNIIIDLAFS